MGEGFLILSFNIKYFTKKMVTMRLSFIFTLLPSEIHLKICTQQPNYTVNNVPEKVITSFTEGYFEEKLMVL